MLIFPRNPLDAIALMHLAQQLLRCRRFLLIGDHPGAIMRM